MQIYYYTRTGRSQQIATTIAKKYNIAINQITDDYDWSGPINFLKGGALASGKKVIEAKYNKPDPNKKIILVFPVWAGSLPPTIRNFIDNNKKYDIIAVPNSLGYKLKERHYFIKVMDLVGKDISIEQIKELELK